MMERATAGQARRIRGTTGGQARPHLPRARREPRSEPCHTPPPARTPPQANSGHNQRAAGRTHGLPPTHSVGAASRPLPRPARPPTAIGKRRPPFCHTQLPHSAPSPPPLATPTASHRPHASAIAGAGPPAHRRGADPLTLATRSAPRCPAACFAVNTQLGLPVPRPRRRRRHFPPRRPVGPHRPARRRLPRLHGGRQRRAAPCHPPLPAADPAAAARLHPTDPFCRPRVRAACGAPLGRQRTPRSPSPAAHSGRGRWPSRHATSPVPRTHGQCVAGRVPCGIILLLGTLEVSPRGRQRGPCFMPTLLTARGGFNNALRVARAAW